MTPGSQAYQFAYEINPITLNGGIAENMPQGFSIINLLQGGAFPEGVLSQTEPLKLDNYFAHFVPAAGGTLSENEIGTYPFANAQVAANAVIAQPLRVALRMICPATKYTNFSAKRAVLQSLKDQLDLHNSSGGYYTVATPSYTYTNCVLLRVSDVSTSKSQQVQIEWQWDFYQPLLTESQASKSLNNLMNKINRGTRFVQTPAWSSIENTVGLPPSQAGIALVPSMQGANSAGSTSPVTGNSGAGG